MNTRERGIDANLGSQVGQTKVSDIVAVSRNVANRFIVEEVMMMSLL